MGRTNEDSDGGGIGLRHRLRRGRGRDREQGNRRSMSTGLGCSGNLFSISPFYVFELEPEFDSECVLFIRPN